MKTKFFKVLFLSTLVLPIFLSAQVTGAPPPTNGVINIENPTNCNPSCNDFMSLLYAILNNVVMPIAAVAVTIWIIYAGFSYLTAQGNPAKVQQAHQRLLWSLIGAGILLGAAGISLVVQNTVKSLIN